MEAATVQWHVVEMVARKPGDNIWNGKSRQFESVENAVRFVMEDIEPVDRGTAIILTDNRTIHLPDIEAMYAGKAARGGQDGGG